MEGWWGDKEGTSPKLCWSPFSNMLPLAMSVIVGGLAGGEGSSMVPLTTGGSSTGIADSDSFDGV
jgi:hypothetical protein